MCLLGVYLGDIYLLHVAIFAHLPKRQLEAEISSSVYIEIFCLIPSFLMSVRRMDAADN